MRHVVIFSFIFISQLVGCVRTEAQKAVYHKISAEKAYQMMNEGEDFILLDVRTEAEYREVHIKGAVLIPVDEIKERAESELPDKAKIIFVYCKSGARSENAARILASLGYVNVYDFGGIINWTQPL
jgi:rhodanese-related sulfurtransferase